VDLELAFVGVDDAHGAAQESLALARARPLARQADEPSRPGAWPRDEIALRVCLREQLEGVDADLTALDRQRIRSAALERRAAEVEQVLALVVGILVGFPDRGQRLR